MLPEFAERIFSALAMTQTLIAISTRIVPAALAYDRRITEMDSLSMFLFRADATARFHIR